MKTHTIRNKSSSTPIVTISQQFMVELLKSSEWSVAVTMSKLLADLKSLTGKQYTLDSESLEELKSLEYKFDQKHFMLRRIFVDGLLKSTIMDAMEVLRLCNDLDRCLNNS